MLFRFIMLMKRHINDKNILSNCWLTNFEFKRFYASLNAICSWKLHQKYQFSLAAAVNCCGFSMAHLLIASFWQLRFVYFCEQSMRKPNKRSISVLTAHSVHASSMNRMISVIALKVLEIGILVANSGIPDSAFVHRQLARKTTERKSNLEVFCVCRINAALHLHRVYHSISNYVTFRFSQCFCLQPSNSRVGVQAAFINKWQSNAM